MSDLNDKLLEIKRQKDTYILPENLKKDVTAFGVTGTYESNGFPSDIHIIKLNDFDIATADPVDFCDVISVTTNLGEGNGDATIINKRTNLPVKLTNTTSPNIRFIYKTKSNKYIVSTKKELNLYNEDFTFNSNIYTHTDTNYDYTTFFYEYHKGSDGYRKVIDGRYIFISSNGLKTWYYDNIDDEIYTINFDPQPSKWWNRNFVECNGYIYGLDNNNKVMYKYDFTSKSLTSMSIADASYNWAGQYNAWSKVDFMYYINSNNKSKLLLSNGTFSGELDIQWNLGTDMLNDVNYIYTSKRVDTTTTFCKISKTDGSITNYATWTGASGGSTWDDAPQYIYNGNLYTQGTKPLKINLSTGNVTEFIYSGTDTYLSNRLVGTDIIFYDRKHMYKINNDGVTLDLFYTIDNQEYGYMCIFTNVYEFTNTSGKEFALLYSTGRNTIWLQNVANYNFGAMVFVYDKQSKTVNRLFPYDTGPTCLINDSGNGIEFSWDIVPDLDNNKIYLRVVPPTEDGMSYGTFGGDIYCVNLYDPIYNNDYVFEHIAAYAGNSIGKGYMFVGNRYISDGINLWLIDAWKNKDREPDWWNYYNIVQFYKWHDEENYAEKELLYVAP